jgi:hypothetical protein
MRRRAKPQARNIKKAMPSPTAGPPGATYVEVCEASEAASAALYPIPGSATMSEGPYEQIHDRGYRDSGDSDPRKPAEGPRHLAVAHDPRRHQYEYCDDDAGDYERHGRRDQPRMPSR